MDSMPSYERVTFFNKSGEAEKEIASPHLNSLGPVAF